MVGIPYQGIGDAGQTRRFWVDVIVPLYEDEEMRKPSWWEHPSHGPSIDAVAIKIEKPEKSIIVSANSESLDLDNIRLIPGLDVFVLGYPEGISGGGRLPIWKRGSIATEPDVHIDDLPKMLIDTATRRGMSGSPIYAQESGLWAPEGATLKEGGMFGKGLRFLGLYSSRVGNDEFLAQIGIVWKEEAIKDIVQSRCRGESIPPYLTGLEADGESD